MKKMIQYRWPIFIVWIAAAILLTVFQPDVNAIIRGRGQSAISSDADSAVAGRIAKKLDTTKGESDLIVFYNKNKLSDKDKEEINAAISKISAAKKKLGITQMIDPVSMPQAAESLYSKDKTTLMISMKVDKKDKSVSELRTQFEKELKGVHTKYYLSGSDFINDDYQTKSEAGVSKSASLTVLFILVILILVFRSVVTPIISLLSVAIAYLTGYGIAAQLIDKANVPATSLTTMLLLLILFGIGTDYNILLFSRFKEELGHGQSVDQAILRSYKTAGKTIAFSIVTVIIAFAALVLAKCPIYKSGAVIVVAIVMLLLEIMTLTPFVMKQFGMKLFWPSKKALSHKENKVWGALSQISTKHSFVSFLLVLILLVPMSLNYKEVLSFNLVGELGNSSKSSEGFNLVSKHFGAGDMMTTTVVIEDTKDLKAADSLAVIDQLTNQLKTVKGVKKVSSVTQPQGKKIDQFYLGSQLGKVADGLGQSKSGLDQISQGLSSMGGAQLGSVTSGLNQISDGMDQTKSYLAGLSDNKTFYMPTQALESPDFQQVLGNFMSKDGKIAKLSIVLKDDPYSEAAQKTVVRIKNVLKYTMESSSLKDTKYGVSGTSANTYDTNSVLTSDLQRTAVVVIIGIFLVLFVIMRSVWASIAMVLSLIGAYFTGATAMNIIFMNIKGLEGISSFVPFFVFIVIMALGVDYSIFLMMRYKEYKDLPVSEAIQKSCKQIDGIVMSAILILGGTFATLIPSGMVLLEELAVGVIVGLIVLCFLLLPIFLPAALVLPEKLSKLFQKQDAIEMKDDYSYMD